jgi:hypothetical protein
MKLIKDNYFLIIFGFLLFVAITYSSVIIYYDIKYYGVIYNGKIIKQKYSYSEVGDEIGVVSNNYTIYVNGANYNGKTNKKTNYKINDTVIVQPKGRKSVKILYVNGNKVANNLGLEDFLAILFLLLLILIPTIIIKQKRK